MHSAGRILPSSSRGRSVTSSTGQAGPRLRIEVLDTEAAMVIRSEDGNWVWAFCLLP